MVRGNAVLRFILFVIFLAGVFFGISFWRTPRTGISYLASATGPLIRVLRESALRAGTLVTTPFLASKLAEENQALHTQMRELTEQTANFAELNNENKALRNELNFFEKEKYPHMVARVTARLNEGGSTFFVVNRGSTDGVSIGMPVVADGVLIGKVIRVQRAGSIVGTLTAAGIKTAATFPGNSKTAGVIEGELNVNLLMQFIAKDIPVSKNDIVITSGLEEHIPRGLLIGRVAYVQSNTQDLFQTAYLQPSIRSEEITLVGIITNIEPISPPL